MALCGNSKSWINPVRYADTWYLRQAVLSDPL
jgi:hypothetical protein